MNEFNLINDAFRKKLPFKHRLTSIPNGDDASVHAIPMGHELVVSTDMSLAGVHWPNDFPLQYAAGRAVNAAISDLAAMGAEASWLWVCAALQDGSAAEMMGEGIAAALKGTGIELAGGDTVHASDNSLSVTVAGLVPEGEAMRRDAARQEDDIWLCGHLGLAALALRRWQQGERCEEEIKAFRDVKPLLDDGMALRGAGVQCCIDISDGLLADAGHLSEASNVAMEIELSLIPSFVELAQQLGNKEAANLVLAGGEDYALVCTAPPALRAALTPIAVRIGHCLTGNGVCALLDGVATHPSQRGFDHFA